MIDKLKISQVAWILLFACTSMFVLGMGDNIRGPLFADLIKNFELTNTQASLSFAITSTFGFLGNLISGKILEKISTAQMLTHSILVMALGLLFMGAASTFSLYLISAAVFGFGMGLIGVAQNLIVVENFVGQKQTQALSTLHGLYGLSSLIAPFVASYAPHFFGPWRSAFYVTAALSLFVYVGAKLIRPEIPILHDSANEQILKSKVSLATLLIFGGILAFYVVAEILVSSRLALYMRQYFEMNLERSSLYVTYFFVFILIGRLIFAFKKFNFDLKFQLNGLLILTFIFLFLGLKAHPFFLVLTGLSMAPFYPLAMAYLSEQTQLQKRRVITFAMGFQNLSLISMHIGVGYLTDSFGLINAFNVGFIAILLTGLCLNLHPRLLAT